MHEHPMTHLVDTGDDSACRAYRPLRSIKGHLLHLIILLLIRMREIAGMLDCLNNREVAGGHIQWCKQMLPYKFLPGLARNALDQIASRHIHQVLILPERTKTLSRLKILQALD